MPALMRGITKMCSTGAPHFRAFCWLRACAHGIVEHSWARDVARAGFRMESKMRGRPAKGRKAKSRTKAAKTARGKSSKAKKASKKKATKSRKTSKAAAKRKTGRKQAVPARKKAARKTASRKTASRKTASRTTPEMGQRAVTALEGGQGSELMQAEQSARSESAES